MKPMKNSRTWIRYSLLLLLLGGAMSTSRKCVAQQRALARKIQADTTLKAVQAMAADLLKTGFNAGSGYSEVWIRDFNTFIALSCMVVPSDMVKAKLRVFFQMQGDDGNIIDGYVPREKAHGGYDYIYRNNAPQFAGHKNTVETDQETSLIQAVYKYIRATGDTAFLSERIAGKPVRDRMRGALQYLMDKRFSRQYGLIYGATTVDWGDVQPETPWGVEMDSSSHPAIDIYDNAMLVIALNDYLDLFPDDKHWASVRAAICKHIMQYLWDDSQHKFIPHIYLAGSPFPADFNENAIHYHGGTAMAILAGLLRKKQIKTVNDRMLADVKAAGAQSIGLTIYPPYPAGFFLNKSMGPYSYQNGGDWTWFGARMITALVRSGFVAEAYRELQPMVQRVLVQGGFHEWYTREGKPAGSGLFRGGAGVLYTAISALQQWAERQATDHHAHGSSARDQGAVIGR